MQKKITIEFNSGEEGWKKGFNTVLDAHYHHDILGERHIDKMGIIRSGPPKPSEVVPTLHFNNTNRGIYTMMVDTEKDGWKQRLAFWKEHSQMRVAGETNTNMKADRFTMRVKQDVDKSNASLIKAKGRVFNRVNNMNISELYDTAYFVGQNPTDMSPNEVYVLLVDYNSGVLQRDPQKFLNDYEQSDATMSVVIRKAIMLAVITIKDGSYYLANNIIGKYNESNIDELVNYFQINDKHYTGYVRQEVAKRDNLDVGVDNELKIHAYIDEVSLQKEDILDEPVSEALADLQKEIDEEEAEKEARKTAKAKKDALDRNAAAAPDVEPAVVNNEEVQELDEKALRAEGKKYKTQNWWNRPLDKLKVDIQNAIIEKESAPATA